MAVAAGLAIGIGQLLRLQFPIYAMISAVVVTDLDPAETRKLGLPRLAGTVLGATLGALISLLLSPSAWEVGLGVLLAMFLSHLLRLQGAAKVAGYVCGIVLFAYDDAPWSYALHRTIERMIGIALVRESDKIHKAFVNRDDREIFEGRSDRKTRLSLEELKQAWQLSLVMANHFLVLGAAVRSLNLVSVRAQSSVNCCG